MTNSIMNYLVFFIGVMMVLLSYFVLRSQQRTFFTPEEQKMKEKEKKLAEYIDLAEEIIEELNTVSEQIIQSIDARTAEMGRMMDEIDKRMKNYKDAINTYPSEISNGSDRIMNFDDDEAGIQREPAQDVAEEEPNLLANGEILRLFEEGNSPSQIAKRLNKGIGEVQLILNLRKK